jgi:hypothetical protein
MATAASGKYPSLTSVFLTVALPTTLLAGLFFLAGKYVEAQPHPQPSVAAQGEMKVSILPDLALITLGVQTGRQNTAEGATTLLDATMKSVLEAVGALGVESKDVQTSNFTLYPAYDFVEGEQVPRGFEASQNVTIKVRQTEKSGDVIAAATKAGANNVSGVQFLVEDMEAVKDQARREAIAKAKQQAELLAEELGMRLGKLMSYGEDATPYVDTSYGRGGYAMGGDGDSMNSIALPSGEQEITVRVYLSYQLR